MDPGVLEQDTELTGGEQSASLIVKLVSLKPEISMEHSGLCHHEIVARKSLVAALLSIVALSATTIWDVRETVLRHGDAASCDELPFSNF